MKIQMLDIDKIKPYEKNPRKNQNAEKIAKSLEQYGWRQPIVVDKDCSNCWSYKIDGCRIFKNEKGTCACCT